MSDWSNALMFEPPDAVILSTSQVSTDYGGVASLQLGTAAWVSANQALYIPFTVSSMSVTAYKMAWENAAVNAAANVDVGIYDESGARLVSSGSTPQSGSNTLQIVDITDTLLRPGLYYMAMVCSTITTATFGRLLHTATALRAGGCQQQASALPLPSSATFATVASAYIPHFCIATKATI